MTDGVVWRLPVKYEDGSIDLIGGTKGTKGTSYIASVKAFLFVFNFNIL